MLPKKGGRPEKFTYQALVDLAILNSKGILQLDSKSRIHDALCQHQCIAEDTHSAMDELKAKDGGTRNKNSSRPLISFCYTFSNGRLFFAWP